MRRPCSVETSLEQRQRIAMPGWRGRVVWCAEGASLKLPMVGSAAHGSGALRDVRLDEEERRCRASTGPRL
jgi:hypothetical protein